MDHMDHFFKAWKESADIEAFLEKKIDLPNPTMIRDHLETLSDDAKAPVYKELMSILTMLEAHAQKMTQGLAETEELLSQSKDAQNVCVSYEKAGLTSDEE